MAKTRTTSTSGRTKQAAQIRHLLVLDALRSGIVPTIAGGLILAVWVLLSVDLIGSKLALSIAAALVLFITLYAGLSPFLDEGTKLGVAGAVITFACAWSLIIFWPLHHTIYAPPPVFTGEIHAGRPPVMVPLHGEAGRYRIVLRGYFPPTSAQTTRAAHYRLHVLDGAGLDVVLEGDFTDTWRQRRVGRRGRFPVHVVSDISQHKIESASGKDLSLALTETGGGMSDVVSVEVAAAGFALPLFAALGAVLAAAALVIDTWRPTVPRNGIITMETLAALVGGAAFSSLAGWRPGFVDLVVSVFAGVVVGAPAGAILWRVASAPVQRLLGRGV
jgi:hypothetical protein